jgi:hypothetical protein
LRRPRWREGGRRWIPFLRRPQAAGPSDLHHGLKPPRAFEHHKSRFYRDLQSSSSRDPSPRRSTDSEASSSGGSPLRRLTYNEASSSSASAPVPRFGRAITWRTTTFRHSLLPR